MEGDGGRWGRIEEDGGGWGRTGQDVGGWGRMGEDGGGRGRMEGEGGRTEEDGGEDMNEMRGSELVYFLVIFLRSKQISERENDSSELNLC